MTFIFNSIFIFFFISTFAFTQVDKKQSILIKVDSTDSDETLQMFRNENDFSPLQDSAYYRALRYKLPIITHLNRHYTYTDKSWGDYIKSLEDEAINIAVNNLRNTPKEYFMPSGEEKVQRELNIMNALDVPFVKTYSPYGMKIPLSAIGSFLGITEDISPTIKYSLDAPANVQVVVYSVKAVVVATIFEGRQLPGNYNLTWNLRDINGKLLPQGDYIIEARVGNENFYRKRTIIQ